MGIIDTTVSVIIIGGVGYLAYDYSTKGWCGGIFKNTPLCGSAGILSGAIDFFSSQYDTGDAGVPFTLDDCPDGWSNDGLICREPISCASGWDFFKEGCSGGRLVGRLNSQTCPKDHPDKEGLLCYRQCPEGWEHTGGMPYLCRNSSTGNFWDQTVGANWKKFLPDFLT